MQATEDTSKRPAGLFQKALWLQGVMMLLSIVITLALQAYLVPRVRDLNEANNRLKTEQSQLKSAKDQLEGEKQNLKTQVNLLNQQKTDLEADIREKKRQQAALANALSNKAGPTATEEAVQKSGAGLPIVYVQIGIEKQRPRARELVKALQAHAYVAPGIENVKRTNPRAKIPDKTELRYSPKADPQIVRGIIGVLENQFGVPTKPDAQPEYKRPRNVFEIWLAPDVLMAK